MVVLNKVDGHNRISIVANGGW